MVSEFTRIINSDLFWQQVVNLDSSFLLRAKKDLDFALFRAHVGDMRTTDLSAAFRAYAEALRSYHNQLGGRKFLMAKMIWRGLMWDLNEYISRLEEIDRVMFMLEEQREAARSLDEKRAIEFLNKPRPKL